MALRWGFEPRRSDGKTKIAKEEKIDTERTEAGRRYTEKRGWRIFGGKRVGRVWLGWVLTLVLSCSLFGSVFSVVF